MRKRRSTCLLSLVLFLALLLCLGALGAGLAAYQLPRLAEQRFGSPSPALDPLQRVYLSGLLLLETNQLTLPADPYGTEVPFEVQLGQSPQTVAANLQSQGLILDAAAFRHYLVYAGLDTTLQAGSYELSPSMPPVEIARELQDATPTEIRFNLLPGWRMEEIAAALPTSGLTFSPEAFLAAAARPPEESSLAGELPPEATLEGFLMPGAYQLSRDLTAGEFVAALLDRFQTEVGPNLRTGFSRQGLSLYEAVTLASIVEREAVVPEEMSLIASVFHNRLQSGLKLDSDPTVQYALGYNPGQETWWTNPLSTADLQINSPYNTYLVAGLPPGPIANPSLDALQAVAFPAETPYYYFRAGCDGSGRHIFAETYEEHLQNACP